jgi:hypothetical protein
LEADRRSLGSRESDRVYRPVLCALVEAGLGNGVDAFATAARPFPTAPFPMSLTWRFRLR